ncbi:FtsX-like permease family protein [Candidatus Laterigemmans baculatus]|uniref:FtsX-like permease family protein n=1 Tax=Candidatus Laterigemmans baculatus TaxID=2770505 RepID=UPI0013D96DF9|nr:FtsX-like permease family protein [Candidatus Laterigemmans baculatus]
MRRTPLAIRNLTHQASRSLVSIGGLTLAITLMFMQLGFLGAVGDTATVVYQRLPMDVLVRSPDYLHLFEPDSIDEGAVYALAAMPEVAEVRALDAVLAPWQNPETFETRAIAAIGLDPPRPGVVLPELSEKLRRLSSPEFVLVDRASREEFGPASGVRFGVDDVGRTAEVSGRRVRIVGTFEMGTGLAAAGAMVLNREGFRRISPLPHEDRASLLLVRLQPGIDADRGRDAVAEALARSDYRGLEVLTASEAMWLERMRWYTETPIGLIFAMGVGLAVVVGGVICYMVLSADVLAKLPEYATLKAIGYSNAFLNRTLLWQSLLMAAAAFLPALGISLGLYSLTSELAAVPIRMTPERIVLVAAMSVAMCMAAGLIALRKLSRAEPASLF